MSQKTSETSVRKPPSYVSLSRLLSGYSPRNNYSSSSTQFSTPPSFISVSSNPQMLDSTKMRESQIVMKSLDVPTLYSSKNKYSLQNEEESLENQTQKSLYIRSNREGSPGSDCSSSSSGISSSSSGHPPTTSGTLVQKQIERLYGGRVHSIHSRSPDNDELEKRNRGFKVHEFSPTQFSKFSKSDKKKEEEEEDVKTHKYPAVFRLLRPEFREILKSHSCKVDIPFENKKSDGQSPPVFKEMYKCPVVKEPPSFSNVPQCSSESFEEKLLESERNLETKEQDLISSEKNQSDTMEESSFDDSSLLPTAGIRERELLCTIVEEDVEGTMIPIETPPKDGHYFIKLIENEIFKFEEHICDFEEELSNNDLIFTDELKEMILSAVGKAKLLIGQKLAQFRGLCDKNIMLQSEEDPFIPTNDDLAGFWDMVFIQVEQIHSCFADLVKIRANGWIIPEIHVAAKTNGGGNKVKSIKKNFNGNNKSPKTISPVSKAREETRKRMMDEKKKLHKLKCQQQSYEDVQIFIQ